MILFVACDQLFVIVNTVQMTTAKVLEVPIMNNFIKCFN